MRQSHHVQRLPYQAGTLPGICAGESLLTIWQVEICIYNKKDQRGSTFPFSIRDDNKLRRTPERHTFRTFACLCWM
jgi:hypothetical protein